MQKLVAALVKARQNFEPVEKDAKGHHGRYATLDSVYKSVLPALLNNGLVLVHLVRRGENGPELIARLLHESGESLDSEGYPLPNLSDQKMGIAMTYGRRYTLCALVAVAADEDDDAEGLNGNDRQPSRSNRKQPPRATRSQGQPQQDSGNGKTPAPTPQPATQLSPQARRFSELALSLGWGKRDISGLYKLCAKSVDNKMSEELDEAEELMVAHRLLAEWGVAQGAFNSTDVALQALIKVVSDGGNPPLRTLVMGWQDHIGQLNSEMEQAS